MLARLDLRGFSGDLDAAVARRGAVGPDAADGVLDAVRDIIESVRR